MKQPFLEVPEKWTRATRASQHPVEYASAIERYQRPASWKTTLLVTAAVVAILGLVALAARGPF